MTVTISGAGPITGSDRAASGTNADITSVTALAAVNTGQLAGLRNRIINGGMQVAQRAAATLTAAYQFGQCDRWQFICSGGTGISGSIVVNAFNAFASGSSGGVTGASWTNGQFYGQQRIEAKNIADLGGKTVTVSAKVYQDTGGSRSFNIQLVKATAGVDNFTTQAAIGTSGALAVATAAVTAISATFTLGASDHLNGIAVLINDTATNTVVAKAYLIGDVQLEVGSVATPFEQRPYGLELLLCQRYYEVFTNGWTGNTTNTANYYGTSNFAATKRANPTLASVAQAGQGNGSINARTASSIQTTGVDIVGAANATVNGGGWIDIWSASAEL